VLSDPSLHRYTTIHTGRFKLFLVSRERWIHVHVHVHVIDACVHVAEMCLLLSTCRVRVGVSYQMRFLSFMRRCRIFCDVQVGVVVSISSSLSVGINDMFSGIFWRLFVDGWLYGRQFTQDISSMDLQPHTTRLQRGLNNNANIEPNRLNVHVYVKPITPHSTLLRIAMSLHLPPPVYLTASKVTTRDRTSCVHRLGYM
jgi:hypothetical protein